MPFETQKNRKIPKLLSIYFKFVIVLAFQLATSDIQAQERLQNVESVMQMIHRSGIFNGNILISKANKVIYRKSFGYADASRSRKLAPGLLFDIGSISKEFSAVSLLLLQKKGKLSINDPVRKYLRELPYWADSVKICHLLNYTSGLPMGTWNSDSAYCTGLNKISALSAAPGTEYLYNYSNVFLQRKIIEKVSGLPYDNFVEKHLFRPLGMTASIVDLSVSSPKMAKAFNSDFTPTPYTTATTGWIKTNIDDLLKWTIGLASYRLIDKHSLQRLSQHFPGGESALGSMVFLDDQLTLHQHHGSNHDYEAMITNDAQTNTIVILQTNSQQFKVHAVTQTILDIMNDRPYQIPKRSLYLDLRGKVLQDLNQGIRFYNLIIDQQDDRYDLNFIVGDLINTGKYLMRRRRSLDALEMLQLCNTLENVARKDLAYAYFLMAACYEQLGKEIQAVLYLKHSLQMDPSNREAAARLQKLKDTSASSVPDCKKY